MPSLHGGTLITVNFYVNEDKEEINPRLDRILTPFLTLYPFVNHFSQFSGGKKPFTGKIIQAYVLGNIFLWS